MGSPLIKAMCGIPRALRGSAAGPPLPADGDPDLRETAAAILATPQAIPVHGAEHFEFAASADAMVATPSRIGLLALFALEMEARGYAVVPEEEED